MKISRRKPAISLLNPPREEIGTNPKQQFLDRYNVKGSCILTIEGGKITTNLQAIVKTFCFIMDKKPSNIIKCCAGYTLKLVRNRAYITRVFSCIHTNPIALYEGDINIKSAFALDIAGNIMHFNINKNTMAIETLSTAIDKIDIISVENLSASSRSKIDTSGKANKKLKTKRQKRGAGSGSSSSSGGGSRY